MSDIHHTYMYMYIHMYDVYLVQQKILTKTKAQFSACSRNLIKKLINHTQIF